LTARTRAIAAAQRALADGAIVAIKGLGGYHLACDATSHEAVATLRQRKGRAAKPFAVMVGDLDGAGALAEINDREAAAPDQPAAADRARPSARRLRAHAERGARQPAGRCAPALHPRPPFALSCRSRRRRPVPGAL
jgi:hypothetical protein